jgi:hypothetical protein
MKGNQKEINEETQSTTQYVIKKVKQSLYTPWRRLGGEEV